MFLRKSFEAQCTFFYSCNHLLIQTIWRLRWRGVSFEDLQCLFKKKKITVRAKCYLKEKLFLKSQLLWNHFIILHFRFSFLNSFCWDPTFYLFTLHPTHDSPSRPSHNPSPIPLPFSPERVEASLGISPSNGTSNLCGTRYIFFHWGQASQPS